MSMEAHGAWPWFRFPSSRFNRAMFKRMNGNDFKAYVWLEAIANDYDPPGKRIGALPPADDIAELMRLSTGKVAGLLTRFVEAGLLRQDGATGRLVVVAWQEQAISDSSTERTRKWRAKQDGNVSPPSRERHRDSLDTDAESETDPDAETMFRGQRVDVP